MLSAASGELHTFSSTSASCFLFSPLSKKDLKSAGFLVMILIRKESEQPWRIHSEDLIESWWYVSVENTFPLCAVLIKHFQADKFEILRDIFYTIISGIAIFCIDSLLIHAMKAQMLIAKVVS